MPAPVEDVVWPDHLDSPLGPRQFTVVRDSGESPLFLREVGLGGRHVPPDVVGDDSWDDVQHQACHVLEVVQGKLVFQEENAKQCDAICQRVTEAEKLLVFRVEVDEVKVRCQRDVTKVEQLKDFPCFTREEPDSLHNMPSCQDVDKGEEVSLWVTTK